jgi:hypothetical protein
MRTASPLTAIRHIRLELDKLEEQVIRRRAMRATPSPALRRSVPQSCGVCGKTGHNSRRHKKR